MDQGSEGRIAVARRPSALVQMRLLLRTALVVALLPLAGVGGRSAAVDAQAASTTAEVAPADALAFVQIPLDESSPQWVLGEELANRAGFGPALADARRELTDAAGKPLPLDAFLGGEAGVVVTEALLAQAVDAAGLGMAMPGQTATFESATPESRPVQGKAAGWAVVLDARAPDTAFAGIEEAVADQAKETGATVSRTDYQGVPIESAPSGTNDKGDDVLGMAAARLDRHILVASTAADLEPLIDTAQGRTDPLSTLDAFGNVRAALGNDPYLLLGFLNGPAAATAEARLGGLGQAAGTLVQGDRYSGFLIRADQPGFRMETVAMAADGSPIAGAAAPFESELAKRTPGDALFFMSAFDLGRTGFLDAVGAGALGVFTGSLGGGTTPTPGQSADEAIAQRYQEIAGLLGFNPQTELLQQLTGEYGLWVRSTDDPSSIAALFASGVADPGKVVNALRRLTLLMQGSAGGESAATTRTVGGSEVTVLPTAPGAPKIEYGVVGDRLLFGVGDAIDRDDRPGDKVLADNAQFKEVMATLPAEHNGTLYVDLSQVIPLVRALGEAGIDVPEPDKVTDANPDCAKFATQAAAQAAYDKLDEGTFNLDQDFDGKACEDFFAATSAAATPEGGPAASAEIDTSAIKAFALAAYDRDGMRRSSAILYIAPAGS